MKFSSGKKCFTLKLLGDVGVALPFAYLHFRSGGITAYVFVGVLIGISFFVLNNMFEYFGNQNAWNPLLDRCCAEFGLLHVFFGRFWFFNLQTLTIQSHDKHDTSNHPLRSRLARPFVALAHSSGCRTFTPPRHRLHHHLRVP
jgi:hypothetical protein